MTLECRTLSESVNRLANLTGWELARLENLRREERAGAQSSRLREEGSGPASWEEVKTAALQPEGRPAGPESYYEIVRRGGTRLETSLRHPRIEKVVPFAAAAAVARDSRLRSRIR